MVISHNMNAINSRRMFGIQNKKIGGLSEKLSTGYKINRSADNAAGLAISEKMRRQIRGLTQASYNAQDGISLCQTAEGALHEVHNMLQRMNELAIKASNGTNSDEERTYLQQEIMQIQSEVNRIAETTVFNDRVLFDGSWDRTAANNGIIAPKIKSIPDVNISIMEAIKTEQRPEGAVSSNNVALTQLLKEELVPNAVQAILNTFPDTFGYLQGSEIGIGLELTTNYDSSILAFVSAGTSMGEMFYKLSVNTAYYMGTEESRSELERTVVHEMMHTLMTEALTAGMAGRDSEGNFTSGFPDWFIEGTAQLVSGAFEPNNNWIYTLNLRDYHDEADIELRLNMNKLGSGSSASEYGTGYLAAMYLGHLVSGSSNFDSEAIADGVDTLLNYIRGGASLDLAIKDLTQYNGIDDFVNNFSKDGAGFTKILMEKVKESSGTGSIIVGKFNTVDILDNGDYSNDVNEGLFALNTDYSVVFNDYSSNQGHVMIEGGSLYDSGEAGEGHPNAAGTGGTPDPDNPGGTGGTTPDPDNPGGTGGTTPDPDNPSGTGSNPGGNTTTQPTAKQGGLVLQIGSDGEESNRMVIYLSGISSASLGIDQINVSTEDGALKAINQVKQTITILSKERAQIGAYQNRLEHTVNNLNNVVENTTDAESRIRDTDMEKLMVEYSNTQILLQAGQAMLTQANHKNEGVLMLLREL